MTGLLGFLRRGSRPRAPSDPNPPAVHRETLAQLGQALGNASTLRNIIDQFCATVPVQFDALQSHVSAGEMVEAARLAHQLRSATGVVGAVKRARC